MTKVLFLMNNYKRFVTKYERPTKKCHQQIYYSRPNVQAHLLFSSKCTRLQIYCLILYLLGWVVSTGDKLPILKIN